MSDLQSLFERDPLTLTKDDIQTIVDQLRAQRKQFAAGNMTAGKAKASPKVKAEAESLLKDLGL